MRIIQLTESEAANSAVMANVAQHLMGAPGADVTHVDVSKPGKTDKASRPSLPSHIHPDSPRGGIVSLDQIAADGITTINLTLPSIGGETVLNYIPKADALSVVNRNNAEAAAQAVQEQRNVAETKIAAADRPDAGFPPDPPAAAPRPDPSNPATIGFGAQPAMVLPFPGATVPVAANLVIPAPNLPLPPVAPPATGAADLDSKGLPWDPRIHSSGDNKKNADGSWRKKRGVPETLVAEVEAELRQIMAIPALAQAPVAAPVIPLPPVPAAVPTVPVAEPMTFSSWMEELTPALNRQLITQELFMQLTKNAHGPDADMNALVMRSDLIPPVRQAMKEWLDANHPGWANAAA